MRSDLPTGPTASITPRTSTTPTTRAPAPSAPVRRVPDRRDRTQLGLTTLFTAREDLGGVVIVADVLSESVRWSA